jgi:hydrogenase nickel incorporation protein HypA/HybF
MHELSVAANILETVQQHVPLDRASAARAVRVQVGDLAGIIADSLDFCFGALVAGTPYDGCHLAIERVPARCDCADCGRIFNLTSPMFACPGCGSSAIATSGGTDLRIVDIELEDEIEART